MKKACFIYLAGLFVLALSFSLTAEWRQTDGLNDEYVNALTVCGSNLFAGTRDSGVFRSADNGMNWQSVNTGLTDLNIRALVMRGTTLFAGARDSGVFRSNDSGASWLAVNTGISSMNIQALAVNDTYLFAGTSGGGVSRSPDNGTNWLEVNKLEDGTDLHFKNIYAFAVSQGYVIIGTWGGSAFRTADNGMNWYLVTNGLADPRENQIPYSFAVGDTFIFSGTQGGGVFRAKDSAGVWFPVNAGLPDSACVTALALYRDSLFAATQKGVYRSTDNGGNWVPDNNGLTDTVVYSFAVCGTYLFAGTRNGVWKYPLSAVPTEGEENPVDLPSAFVLQQNSPNPFNATTLIRYKIPVTGFVSLIVYDTRGKIIASVVDEIKIRGAYSARFNASMLANGIYLCRLQAGGVVKSRTMLRVR